MESALTKTLFPEIEPFHHSFIKTRNGFQVTGVEGFVAIDKLKGGAVKLVDRMTFSYNNFSSDVIKGWDTPSRS